MAVVSSPSNSAGWVDAAHDIENGERRTSCLASNPWQIVLHNGEKRNLAHSLVAARSILTSIAADGVTRPLRYVLSREALVPTSWANSALVSPDRDTAWRRRAATSARSAP